MIHLQGCVDSALRLNYTSLLVIILSIDIILSKCFQDSLVQFSPYFLDVHKPQSGWHHQVPPILRPKNPPMRRCSDTYTGELKLKMLLEILQNFGSAYGFWEPVAANFSKVWQFLVELF
ncbi:hypothetical protein FOXB_07350 [Fusarium oxysporum f. sp. conglutinans Fo5176]|uniref:Uncharacterized protein n=1 Tax=Fusarium oxysporum (strain Fo5176) TaxID=660025 RepID=F9FLS0_FUSOF|nr:hypothetical protein FOXB_07350 [Fusarium oxysporum f. sp. conglutinans Fo5176]